MTKELSSEEKQEIFEDRLPDGLTMCFKYEGGLYWKTAPSYKVIGDEDAYFDVFKLGFRQLLKREKITKE